MNSLLQKYTITPMSSNETVERLLGAFTQALANTKKNGHKALYKFEDNLKGQLEVLELSPEFIGFYIRFYRRDRFRSGYSYSIEARSRGTSGVYYSAYIDTESNTLEALAEGLNDSWQRLEKWKHDEKQERDERSNEFRSNAEYVASRLIRELEYKIEGQGTKETLATRLKEMVHALDVVTSYVKQAQKELETI